MDPGSESQRWVGVGRSSSPDASSAALEAVSAALRGRPAELVVLFASEAMDLPALVETAYETGRHAPLIGCSMASEIATGGPGEAGVVAVGFGGPGFSVSTTALAGVADGARAAGAEVAACLGDVTDSEHRVLLMLTDGLAGDQQEIIRGAYGVAGAGVPLVGGCAGDDLKLTGT